MNSSLMIEEQPCFPSKERLWEQYYADVKRKDIFKNTTPYLGLKSSNSEHLNEIALEYFGTKISFGKLFQKIDAVAKALKASGVNKGDFITVCSTATPEVVYLFYAASKIGAVVNAISPFFKAEDLVNAVYRCNSKLIFVTDIFFSTLEKSLEMLGDCTKVIIPLMNSSRLKFFHHRFRRDDRLRVTWKEFLKKAINVSDAEEVKYTSAMPMAMIYSSGTTGASKGILLSVDSFEKLINAYGNSGFDTSRGQSVYQNIPCWSATGLSLGINFPLSYGVKVCIDPRFDNKVFIRNVLKFKPEYILTTTKMYTSFIDSDMGKMLKGKSLRFLKYPVEGGEPLTNKDIESIERVFFDHGSNAHLLNGYGMCECGATITTDITNHIFSHESSGIPLPEIVTIGIFDDDYNELSYNQRGNILVKTEIGMTEYYKNPDATNTFFRYDNNGDKWSITGDIGYIKDDGSLVVLGRKSDVSIINGLKVYNFDVEKAILKHKEVKLCEVQTLPDDDGSLAAHIIFWNEEAENKTDRFLQEIQNTVMSETGRKECVPEFFCIHKTFPSALSGKRDDGSIKNDMEGMIHIKYDKN